MRVLMVQVPSFRTIILNKYKQSYSQIEQEVLANKISFMVYGNV